MNLTSENEDEILDEMWRWCQTYNLTIENQPQTLWYFLDEFGSKIRHHGDANFILVPFFCQFYGYSISLLFPKRSVPEYAEINRDFCYGITDTDVRRIQMFPWVKSKLSVPRLTPAKPQEFFEMIADKLKMKMPTVESFH